MASELQERFRMKMEEKLKGCADQDTVKGIMDRGTRLRPEKPQNSPPKPRNHELV